jgi:RNA polymerase sigma-70 factor, ECF subfamily
VGTVLRRVQRSCAGVEWSRITEATIQAEHLAAIAGSMDIAMPSAHEHGSPAEDFATPARIASGVSPSAWLNEHGDYLYGYALSRVRDAHEAEDLVQETLLAAMQGFASFEGRSSVRTWLTAVLRHKLQDRVRRLARGRHLPLPEDDHEAEAGIERFADARFDSAGKWKPAPIAWSPRAEEPADEAMTEELRRVLLDCLERLPTRSGAALDLAERAGMSLSQISNLLQITATNAGVLLHRARLALRECLEEKWFRER